ncbi:long-subunit acyl-CoA synthetase (AMP-forming) [Bradyrhizobium sp. SBR1B]|nr:long-subunit acyl-CoA synthetase (AMP-forming) [Bradyrhizobium sp. SBR1B]
MARGIAELSGHYRPDRTHPGRVHAAWPATGARVAFLTANRADTWCAGVAAQLSRLCITWLHPLGSLEDQLFQLEDSEAEMLVVDAAAFRDRGGELSARATRLKAIFTTGPAG